MATLKAEIEDKKRVKMVVKDNDSCYLEYENDGKGYQYVRSVAYSSSGVNKKDFFKFTDRAMIALKKGLEEVKIHEPNQIFTKGMNFFFKLVSNPIIVFIVGYFFGFVTAYKP